MPEIKAKLVLSTTGGGLGGTASGGSAASSSGGTALKGAMGTLSKNVKTLQKGTIGKLTAIVTLLKPVATFATLAIAGMAGMLALNIGAFFKGMEKFKEDIETLKEKWQDFKDWLDEMDLFDSVRTKFKSFKEWFGGVWDKLKSSDLGATVKSGWDTVKDIYTSYNDWLVDKWSSLWDGLKGGFFTFVNGIINLVNKLPFVNIPSIGGGAKQGQQGQDINVDRSTDLNRNTSAIKGMDKANAELMLGFQQTTDILGLAIEITNHAAVVNDRDTVSINLKTQAMKKNNIQLREQVRLQSELMASKRSDKYKSGGDYGTTYSSKYGTQNYSTRYGVAHPSRQTYNEAGSVSGYSSTGNNVQWKKSSYWSPSSIGEAKN